jgi:hypothetical protein
MEILKDTARGLLPVCVLLFAGLAQASQLTIPVNCNGQFVGTINIDPGAANNQHGSGVNGGFNAAPPLTLAGVEAACGEDHLNWFQTVDSDNFPGVDANGNRLVPPYVDPPLGGYGDDPNTPGDDTDWGDNLLWYYNEGPPPNRRANSFPGTNLNNCWVVAVGNSR